MGRPRVYSFAKRRCKRDPECLSIDGHYGRCILPTERTRKAIADDPKLQAVLARTKQLGLFGSGG